LVISLRRRHSAWRAAASNAHRSLPAV